MHVRDLELTSAPDPDILDRAAADERIIISADTDFGALLAHRRATGPSVILVREIVGCAPDAMAERLAAQLPALASDLSAGAIAALTLHGARVRALPLR